MALNVRVFSVSGLGTHYELPIDATGQDLYDECGLFVGQSLFYQNRPIDLDKPLADQDVSQDSDFEVRLVATCWAIANALGSIYRVIFDPLRRRFMFWDGSELVRGDLEYFDGDKNFPTDQYRYEVIDSRGVEKDTEFIDDVVASVPDAIRPLRQMVRHHYENFLGTYNYVVMKFVQVPMVEHPDVERFLSDSPP